jgi:hypothetical protein
MASLVPGAGAVVSTNLLFHPAGSSWSGPATAAV